MNFAIIGAAGYIAPRHIKAIYDTGNKVVAAYDKNDSVGILDSFSKSICFFKTFEEYHCYVSTELKDSLNFTTICSPNFLHKPHILLSLEMGSNVICEKPLVLSSQDIYLLRDREHRSGKKVYTILQLREHDAIQNLKTKINNETEKEKHEVTLTYITSRGPWYQTTWKAEYRKSGGLGFNIGIHFFDILYWLFGDVQKSELHVNQADVMSGYFELEKARVRWFLSINENHLPDIAVKNGLSTYRSLLINDHEIEFSSGFNNLHTKVYSSILKGHGHNLADASKAIKIVENLYKKQSIGISPCSHSYLRYL
ncbi:Gfo/Idh/MocA family oxidoreductase [Pseudobacteriovorax antillogorgiicola]|uniref:UDP-N-acetyl-2-amino-2-deoxyglucuronate dehydrogenase n=1 Tax=Pseudobacteriovorax antillogorgiicola TaxID=1513793 RepID=A0A1Y6CMU5_9BACT|nr:Gfo/Idh/MocA family oxidoreductase [Pseudobacteriovorax antillogorgiicola]TCS45226.1 UDP-N-acetyl-2-amino-2-deoxyglucuronate dehydrogenase [Pseudobacteriovorax antillogorgiicola]SMF75383.1 UDP-N-acetyl-2-amino-2-deoxyglucuronate dehydrogenase [Pseudobacteriovorax antillogorgiicola]